MTDIDGQQTLATIVTNLPGSARVFERWGIDYCCHGQRPLDDACAELSVDVTSVLGELETLGDPTPAEWASLSTSELTEHIVEVHHKYLKAELPRLVALAQKVNAVHGGRHAELAEVAQLVERTQAELVPHMQREELMIYPAVRKVIVDPTFEPRFGNFDGPLSDLIREHDDQGEILDRLIEITDDFQVPADGCASYAALYDGLREMNQDTRLHVHKENNVLFPAVKELEANLAGASS